jgi:DNA repair exonuclease SbcCD ATPase subunit
MANTDFFDEDLVQQRDAAKRVKLGPGDATAQNPADTSAGDGLPTRPVSDLNLTRMARHREDVEDQVAHASEELERLKQRQSDLEREKKTLEELRNKQDQYESGRREMIERLNQSLITLEKDEIRTEQLRDLLADTRQRFKSMLDDIEGIRTDDWEDERISEELAKALAIISDSRIEYNKALAKVQAAMGDDSRATQTKPVVFEESYARYPVEHGFGYWLKAGIAFTLPLLVIAVIIAVVTIYLQMQALI